MEKLPYKNESQSDKSLEPIGIEQINNVFNEMASSFSIYQKNLQKLMEPMQVQFNQIADSLRQFQKVFPAFAENERKKRAIAKIFQESNLWLAPSMIPIVDTIVELYEQNKKERIPGAVADYYEANDYSNLKKTVESWTNNKYFKPRVTIFADALEAHISGKFNLSVPSLLPQIEGITHAIIKESKIPELKGPIFFTQETAGRDGDTTLASRIFANIGLGEFGFNEWVSVYSLLYYLEGTMYLSPRKHQKKLEDFATKDILNRNSILHGIHIEYGTSMNSLRCFLALDVISLLNDKVID